MIRASAAQRERAKCLLTHEAADSTSAGECAAAAGRVYDKLHDQLAPLLGAAGAGALFERSAQLVHREFAFIEAAVVESAMRLRECLQAQEPAVAQEAAAALFGTLFTIIITFIGERLTAEVLRSAWPAIEDPASKEAGK